MVVVQSNIDLTTFWTKSFLEIKELWERFGKDNDLEIQGYLNPYGVEIDLSGIIGEFKLNIKVQKRLVNTRGSEFTMKPSMYMNIITIEGTSMVKSDHSMLIYRKRKIWQSLVASIKGWKFRWTINQFKVLSNQEVDKRRVEILAGDDGFYKFKQHRGSFFYKRVEQVESRERLDEIMEGILVTK